MHLLEIYTLLRIDEFEKVHRQHEADGGREDATHFPSAAPLNKGMFSLPVLLYRIFNRHTS